MKHFLQEMEKLTHDLDELAETVTATILKATVALCERRPELAQQVIAGDDAIDREEVRIEEECVRILVLQQPVAIDLRRVIAALKINGDLERMADLAADIAEQATEFARLSDHAPIPPQFLAQTSLVVRMVRDCLDAFVRSDAGAARAVCALDHEADRRHREIVEEIKAMIRSHPEQIDAGFQLVSAARYLERIANHAANIAEDVIYTEEGTIIRHQPTKQPGAA